MTALLQIEASGEKCLGDFTFDFFWQHRGSRLDPDKTVCSGISYRKIVEALRQGQTVKISGNAGGRLASSLGVDLMHFGGSGGPLEKTGKIIVDGDVGSHMGISMLRGSIYVSGKVEPPLGNVLKQDSDLSGYRKFISVTEALEKGLPVSEPNRHDRDGRGLCICDGLLRDTLGARNPADKFIRLEGDAGMSTGILMLSGQIEVSENSGRNTGVLLRGGRIVVYGDTDDFTGAEMKGGEIFVAGDAGSYACARMKGGAVFAREGKPLPPAKTYQPSSSEQTTLARTLGLSPLYAMMYRKFSL